MAFNLTRFTRVSLAFNTGRLVLDDATLRNGPAFFTYASADDSVATISGANYFNDEGCIYDLQVADLIAVVGSDANTFLEVLTVDTTTSPKTITTTAFTASGTVNTANIVDGAVTNAKVNAAAAISFSKLATLATGHILAGNAGVVTDVALSGDATIGATGVLTIANAAVTSAKLALTTVQYAAVAITAAQFNGMYAAPKLLVAAGGANTLLVLDKVQLLQTYVSAAYASGGTAAVQYDSTVNGAGVIASTTLANTVFQGTVSVGFNMNAGVVAETFSTCVNKGLYLSNITGAYTTGDSTFVAHVWYKVIPTV